MSASGDPSRPLPIWATQKNRPRYHLDADCARATPLGKLPRGRPARLGPLLLNCDFSKSPIHAFGDPTLRRGQVSNLVPGHILVLLGSEPIVFPIHQIEIDIGVWISIPSPSARRLVSWLRGSMACRLWAESVATTRELVNAKDGLGLRVLPGPGAIAAKVSDRPWTVGIGTTSPHRRQASMCAHCKYVLQVRRYADYGCAEQYRHDAPAAVL